MSTCCEIQIVISVAGGELDQSIPNQALGRLRLKAIDDDRSQFKSEAVQLGDGIDLVLTAEPPGSQTTQGRTRDSSSPGSSSPRRRSSTLPRPAGTRPARRRRPSPQLQVSAPLLVGARVSHSLAPFFLSINRELSFNQI